MWVVLMGVGGPYLAWAGREPTQEVWAGGRRTVCRGTWWASVFSDLIVPGELGCGTASLPQRLE
jgi:hypothetical protein